MKKYIIFKFVCFILFIFSLSVSLLFAENKADNNTESPEFLYQQALYLETVKEDYNEAIKIYSRIITTEEKNREMMAKSLYRMAECYEKIGEIEKVKEVASKLINEYEVYIKSIEGASDFVIKYKTEIMTEKQIIKPTEVTFNFQDIDVKVALITIFTKYNIKYKFDTEEIEGKITLSLTNKNNIESILDLVLKPSYVIWEKDKNGIYHIKKKEPKPPENIISTNIGYLSSGISNIEYENLCSPVLGILASLRCGNNNSNGLFISRGIADGIGGNVGIRYYLSKNHKDSFVGIQIWIQQSGISEYKYSFSWDSSSSATETLKQSDFYIGPVLEYGYRWIWGNFTIYSNIMLGYGLRKTSTTVKNFGTQTITNDSVTYNGVILRGAGLNIGIAF